MSNSNPGGEEEDLLLLGAGVTRRRNLGKGHGASGGGREIFL
jgi:hypothetical protein